MAKPLMVPRRGRAKSSDTGGQRVPRRRADGRPNSSHAVPTANPLPTLERQGPPVRRPTGSVDLP
eukprot:15411373-Alexandrium_andersonii.AAC.1